MLFHIATTNSSNSFEEEEEEDGALGDEDEMVGEQGGDRDSLEDDDADNESFDLSISCSISCLALWMSFLLFLSIFSSNLSLFLCSGKNGGGDAEGKEDGEGDLEGGGGEDGEVGHEIDVAGESILISACGDCSSEQIWLDFPLRLFPLPWTARLNLRENECCLKRRFWNHFLKDDKSIPTCIAICFLSSFEG